MFATSRTGSVRWDLLGALLVSGWVTSLAGSMIAGFSLASTEGTTAFTSVIATFAGVVLQTIFLRWAVAEMTAGRLSLTDAFLVALVGQLTLALGQFLIGRLGASMPLAGAVGLFSLVGVYFQYQLLLVLAKEQVEAERSHPIVTALLEDEELR